MNKAKLMGVTLGLVLLGGHGLALADGGKDRGDRGRHEWNGHRGYDGGRHEGWHRGSPRWHKHQRHPHYYPRWHHPHRHYPPPRYRSGWGPSYGYDDGVTIIFKGRID